MNTPRSVEACKRQGIEPHELLYQSMATYKKSLGVEGASLHTDQVRLRWGHLEQRRREKVRVIKEERALIAYEEINGQWRAPTTSQLSAGSPKKSVGFRGASVQSSPSKTAISGGGAKESAMIEKEMQELERIKHKQVII